MKSVFNFPAQYQAIGWGDCVVSKIKKLPQRAQSKLGFRIRGLKRKGRKELWG